MTEIRVTKVSTEVLVEPEHDPAPVRVTSIGTEVLVMPPPDAFPIRVTKASIEVLVRPEQGSLFQIDGDKLEIGPGFPLDAGDYPITIRCTDKAGRTLDKEFTITIVE